MYPWLQDAWNEFQQRACSDRMAHAIVLTGQSGTGKQQFSEMMCQWLLCLEPGERACGQCRSCQLLKGQAHPEKFLLEPEEGKQFIVVDMVRSLVNSMSLSTTISPRKVALIRPAEAMNAAAANALLKNLEEPPGQSFLILVCSDPKRLPVTIRSRCQFINVATPDRDLALSWLAENSQEPREQAEQALEASGGSPLTALGYIEQELLGDFINLRTSLSGLLGKPSKATASAAALADLEPSVLWSWLSMDAASAIRTVMTTGQSDWLERPDGIHLLTLTQLQQRADRNRFMGRAAVRQDLLLQEWLLEWARQPAQLTVT